jgi:hypothetical protein
MDGKMVNRPSMLCLACVLATLALPSLAVVVAQGGARGRAAVPRRRFASAHGLQPRPQAGHSRLAVVGRGSPHVGDVHW